MVEFMARYSPRERLIVMFAMVVIVALLLHMLIIEPYLQKKADLFDQIEQGRSDLQWIASIVNRLPRDENSGAQGEEFDGTLVNLINQTVKQEKLDQYLAQMTPKGDDEIRVRFTAIPFERVIRFVAMLNDRGLNLKDLRINAADNPGQVDSSLVLNKG